MDVRVESGFPWDGRVRIHVRAKHSGFRLALCIPGWCEGYTVTCGGEFEKTEKDGCLYLKKEWGEEDILELDFPMYVKLIAANPAVRETIGKVAVTRGPVVYCLEEADNGKNLHLLSVDPSGSADVIEEAVCGEKAKTVLLCGWREREANQTQELYHVWRKERKEAVMLKFIPYYMWANRMENEMRVWVRR